MKKFVLIPCFLGFIFLIVGGVLASPSVQRTFSYTIHASGTIGDSEESQSQQADYQTPLDQIGYLTIFAGIGFFIGAFLYNRKSSAMLY